MPLRHEFLALTDPYFFRPLHTRKPLEILLPIAGLSYIPLWPGHSNNNSVYFVIRSLFALFASTNVYKMNSTTATATSLDPLHPAINGVTRRANSNAIDGEKPRDEAVQTSETDANAEVTEELRRAFRRKYRHVVAVHSESRPSCLSHDTTESPSFLGFRNLMVIVLCKIHIYTPFSSHTKETNSLTSNLHYSRGQSSSSD